MMRYNQHTRSPTLIPRIMLLLGLAACSLFVVLTRPSASPPAPQRTLISEADCLSMTENIKFISEEKIDREPEWHVGMNQIKYFNNDPNDDGIQDWSGPCSNCWDQVKQCPKHYRERKISQRTKDLSCYGLEQGPMCPTCVGTGHGSSDADMDRDLAHIKNQLENLRINWRNTVHFHVSSSPALMHKSFDAAGRDCSEPSSEDVEEHTTYVEQFDGMGYAVEVEKGANVTIELHEEGQPIRHYIRFGMHISYELKDHHPNELVRCNSPLINRLTAYLEASSEARPCLKCGGVMMICKKSGKGLEACDSFHWGTGCKKRRCPTCYVASANQCTALAMRTWTEI